MLRYKMVSAMKCLPAPPSTGHTDLRSGAGGPGVPSPRHSGTPICLPPCGLALLLPGPASPPPPAPPPLTPRPVSQSTLLPGPQAARSSGSVANSASPKTWHQQLVPQQRWGGGSGAWLRDFPVTTTSLHSSGKPRPLQEKVTWRPLIFPGSR